MLCTSVWPAWIDRLSADGWEATARTTGGLFLVTMWCHQITALIFYAESIIVPNCSQGKNATKTGVKFHTTKQDKKRHTHIRDRRLDRQERKKYIYSGFHMRWTRSGKKTANMQILDRKATAWEIAGEILRKAEGMRARKCWTLNRVSTRDANALACVKRWHQQKASSLYKVASLPTAHQKVEIFFNFLF